MQRYLVCSGKGGVGKSTVSVCLARALCARGKSVLLIDCDVGLRSLDLLTGLGMGAVYTWQDVLDGNCTLSDALLRDAYGMLSLLIPPQEQDAPFDAEKFSKMLARASVDFDFCFLDAGAGVDGLVSELSRCADAALVVATPDAVSARAAARTAEMLCTANPETESRLLLNRYSVESVRGGVCVSADRMIDETGLRLLGAVPEDAGLRALSHGVSASAKTQAAFSRIAARMLGEQVPFRERKLKSTLF